MKNKILRFARYVAYDIMFASGTVLLIGITLSLAASISSVVPTVPFIADIMAIAVIGFLPTFVPLMIGRYFLWKKEHGHVLQNIAKSIASIRDNLEKNEEDDDEDFDWDDDDVDDSDCRLDEDDLQADNNAVQEDSSSEI